jgi:prolyl-tRNA editing enzyme YbaK/EbsC (Cys-tRNA(Pro) deacylase)
MDQRVLENEYVIGGGGAIDRLLRIRPERILEYQQAEVMDVRE